MSNEALMQFAYCDNVEVLYLTDRLCEDVNERGVAGDFCEAGVAMAVHPVIMARYNRPVHLFDSFDGIPTHGSNDIEWTEAHGVGEDNQRKSGGITVCSRYDVETFLKVHSDINKFIFHQGWFIDTFEKLSDERFSVLRLDCDLYESYMLCFKHLFPRLNKGGWLIIDDFTLSGCKQAIKDSNVNKEFTIMGNIAYCKI